MPGDLHNHSTCSDGSVPIHRLPLMAGAGRVWTPMAISDHDTLLSVNYCYEHRCRTGCICSRRLSSPATTTSIVTGCTCCAITRTRKTGSEGALRHPAPAAATSAVCKAQRKSKRCIRSSARNRHWNTQKTAVYCSKAALWRHCISWACAMPYMAGCTVTFLAGSRAAWCCIR